MPHSGPAPGHDAPVPTADENHERPCATPAELSGWTRRGAAGAAAMRRRRDAVAFAWNPAAGPRPQMLMGGARVRRAGGFQARRRRARGVARWCPVLLRAARTGLRTGGGT